MQKPLLLILLLNSLIFNSLGQDKKPYSRKGEYYFFWGYNRSSYANSDITFKGKGYDFTLHDVVANDLPIAFSTEEYLDITRLSIPQYNFRYGYFLNNHLSISIGSDHMKYIMVNEQNASITGHISDKISDPNIDIKAINPNYVGDFNHQPFKIGKEFLTFEHSDGFNYLHIDLDYYDRLWKAKNNIQGVDWLVGLGAGTLIPRSDVKLFGVGQNNHFNFAGYGLSAKTGLRFDLSRRFFFQTDFMAGFVRLNNVHTTGRNDQDYAQQSIWFGQFYGALGYKFGKNRVK
jgi:hypothetical protein